ncbi:MAG: hypothetical protein AB7T10_09345 [bacterium]
MNKKVLWSLLILLLSTFLFSNELPITITPDSITTDTNSISIINPQTKKEKSHFSIGYNLGVCYRGRENSFLTGSGDFQLLPDIEDLISSMFYFIHSVEFKFDYPFKNTCSEIGLGMSVAKVNSSFYTGISDSMDFYGTLAGGVDAFFGYENLYRFYFFNDYQLNQNAFIGAELNYGLVRGHEVYFSGDNGGMLKSVYNVRRHLVGGGLFVKFLTTENSAIKWFKPYSIFRLSGSEEIYSDSPYKELWNEKLTHWYIGAYVGFNLF